MKKFALLTLIVSFVAGCTVSQPATAVFETTLGDITVELSDKTPLHRDNFINLVKTGYYDSLLFHRVIDGFMIQGGDPASRNAMPGEWLGEGDTGYSVPAEFGLPDLTNRRGALAAAREGDDVNPERKSSGSQFYIVVADSPHLDGAYTVFGRVVKGMDVVDAIAKAATDANNRPLQDIRIIKARMKSDSRTTSSPLVGVWTMPNPIDAQQRQGFVLFDGGVAESVGYHTLVYTKWSAAGNRLTLSGKSIGNGQTIDFDETCDYRMPDENTLVILQDSVETAYRRNDF